MIRIKSQGYITSKADLFKLDIVQWQRLKSYELIDMHVQVAENLLSGSLYRVLEIRLRDYPIRADWPGWKHAGHHESLGRLYWNFFHATNIGHLSFADMPDFQGTIESPELPCPMNFYGDIGQVSPHVFLETVRRMQAHELWISVQDEMTQVVIEPLVDIRRFVLAHLNSTFGKA